MNSKIYFFRDGKFSTLEMSHVALPQRANGRDKNMVLASYFYHLKYNLFNKLIKQDVIRRFFIPAPI